MEHSILPFEIRRLKKSKRTFDNTRFVPVAKGLESLFPNRFSPNGYFYAHHSLDWPHPLGYASEPIAALQLLKFLTLHTHALISSKQIHPGLWFLKLSPKPSNVA